MRKLRLIPWLFGVALIVTTVAGANRLLHPTDPASGGGPPVLPPKAPPPVSSEGLVAKGTVQSDPPLVAYGLPAHLSAGSIVEVFVHGGQEVKANDPLLRYDDTLLTKDKEKAEYGYNAALQEYNTAVVKQKQHAILLQKADLAVKDAEQKRDKAKEAHDLAKRVLQKELDVRKNENGSPLTAQQIEQYRNDDLRTFQARAVVDSAEHEVTNKKYDKLLAEGQAEELQIAANKAAYYSEALKRDVEKAKQAIADCTLRAKADGVIEQVTAAKGQTVYPQSRPLFYLVPSGKRVVWAEVVPDFAHKISGRENKEVTISDDSNTHLTYKGTVKRIGGAFLPKPNGAPDIINGKPNVVLIVEVEVLDAAPSGKPPLRVGQPVRVTFRE